MNHASFCKMEHHGVRYTLFSTRSSLLDDDFQFDAAQLKFVPVFQHVRQVWGQALPISEGAVGAADVLDQVGLAPLVDPAVAAGDATREPAIRGEVHIRKDATSLIETPDVYLGHGWQLDLAAGG